MLKLHVSRADASRMPTLRTIIENRIAELVATRLEPLARPTPALVRPERPYDALYADLRPLDVRA